MMQRARRFRDALRDPQRGQAETLGRIMRIIAGSPYARSHGIGADVSYDTFAARVPIVEYEDLRPWIDREAATGVPQLSSEPAELFEQTSGSSGKSKLVPYTRSLLESFNACFVIWASDVLRHGPRLETARMFWGVSPAIETGGRTTHGTPISLADDAGYLAPHYQRLLARLLVVPTGLKRITDGEAYRRALAAVLVAEPELEIVSVWSPTYLLAILDSITTRRGEIIADLRAGRTGPCGEIELPPSGAARASLLADDPIRWDRLWPQLKLVSCWTEAGAGTFVPALRHAFPQALIQGKGLLATEAALTVPLFSVPAPVPLVDEVFLEFESNEGSVRRLHELEEGAEYGIIVSQTGGFLRYRMGDRVQVAGRVDRTPCLKFLGRAGCSSDLAGEKLDEALARAVLAAELGPDGHCSYLTPITNPPPPGYCCITDHSAAAVDPEALARRLDHALSRSFQYRQARHLGQLNPLHVRYRADARAAYEAAQMGRGLRWGNVKFTALHLPV
jgi:hypothetical protein